MPPQAPLRWLGARDVIRAMPPIEERLRLAEETMTSLATGAELPAKIEVHGRPEGSFANAMPASRRGAERTGDRMGIKWVTGFPTNAERGLPAIHAIIILSDPATGVAVALLDGGPITAARTAAVSGVAIRRWGRRDHPARVAIIGAGVQGRAHAEIVAHVLPGSTLVIHSRSRSSAEALAAFADDLDGLAPTEVAGTARDAVDGADVVVTAASFGPVRQVLTSDWLEAGATVVAVDYATYASAELARRAALFLVDERGQFEAFRAAGAFDGYPDPSMTIGEAIHRDVRRPAGLVLVSHLGVGLADVMFGGAILERATTLGLGVVLPR